MKVLLITIGSHGDVHPFVGLGITLRSRGHDVTVVTNAHFEPLARAANLGFVELGSSDDFQRMIKDPDIWHRKKGFKAIFLNGVIPLMEKTYRIVEEHYVPGETVVVKSSLGFGARIAQEKLGVPTVSVHLAPSIMRTVHDVPKLPGLFMPRWFPTWLKRGIWDGGDRYVIDPVLAPPVNQFRATVGLAEPVKWILRDWWHSPTRVIGMWPRWFGPEQPDWPQQVRLVGFPLFDESGITPMSGELDAWLGAGPPPVAFTPGSAMIHGQGFFEASARACEILGARGILLTRHGDQIPQELPPNVRHVDYAPFKDLLPRCAALVHHGGIGTTAQGLRAGVPQVVMPLSHDQFDNGARVEALGVGWRVQRWQYKPRRVAKVLGGMIESPAIRERCREVAERFVGVDALSAASDLIESVLAPAGSGASALSAAGASRGDSGD